MKTSAGCLVRAALEGSTRYLLVHPSGGYNRRAPWSIPKGLVEPGEAPEACAVRETFEETGIRCRIVSSLGEAVLRKSWKRILGFLAEPEDPPAASRLAPASWEVDQVEFLTADEARAKIHPDQAVFIDRAESPP